MLGAADAQAAGGVETDSTIERLFLFAKAHGAETSHMHVANGANGRGLFATKRLLEGETLLYLPQALLVTSDLADQESCLKGLLSSQEAEAFGFPLRPELRLMLFLVADRARCDGYQRDSEESAVESPCTTMDAPSLPEAGGGVSTGSDLYHEFTLQLSGAPRNPDGTLSQPARLLHWLEDAAQLTLTPEGAGKLLAIIDLKGKPSLADFCRCCRIEATAPVGGAPPKPLAERPPRALFYSSMPQAYPELPMHWPDDALDGLLPPARAAFARAQREERDLLTSLLAKYAPTLWAFAQRVWTERGRWADPISWAHATVRSRSYGARDESNGSTRTLAALVPLADLANHATPHQASAMWSFDGRGYEARATRSIGEGEEIFVTYGAKPNGDLLMHYGFTMDANAEEEGPLDDVLLTLERTDEAREASPPERRKVCVYVRPAVEDDGVRHAIALLRELVRADDSPHEGVDSSVFTAAKMESGWLVPIGMCAPGRGLPPVSDENEFEAIVRLGRRARSALEQLQAFLKARPRAPLPGSTWPPNAARSATVVCLGEMAALRWLVGACESSLEAQREHRRGRVQEA